ncbi:MAG: helix-turn-helix domain-containing protein [Campylobacter sp.]
MKEIDDTIRALKDITSSKTDKDLSEKLGIKYKTLSMWKFRDKIPADELLEISKKLGVSIEQLTGAVVIGQNNIAISGNGNQITTQKHDILNTPKFREFIELFKLYGNDAALDSFIAKLKALKKALDE